MKKLFTFLMLLTIVLITSNVGFATNGTTAKASEKEYITQLDVSINITISHEIVLIDDLSIFTSNVSDLQNINKINLGYYKTTGSKFINEKYFFKSKVFENSISINKNFNTPLLHSVIFRKARDNIRLNTK